jgi:hypothetical protein
VETANSRSDGETTIPSLAVESHHSAASANLGADVVGGGMAAAGMKTGATGLRVGMSQGAARNK